MSDLSNNPASSSAGPRAGRRRKKVTLAGRPRARRRQRLQLSGPGPGAADSRRDHPAGSNLSRAQLPLLPPAGPPAAGASLAQAVERKLLGLSGAKAAQPSPQPSTSTAAAASAAAAPEPVTASRQGWAPAAVAVTAGGVSLAGAMQQRLDALTATFTPAAEPGAGHPPDGAARHHDSSHPPAAEPGAGHPPDGAAGHHDGSHPPAAEAALPAPDSASARGPAPASSVPAQGPAPASSVPAQGPAPASSVPAQGPAPRPSEPASAHRPASRGPGADRHSARPHGRPRSDGEPPASAAGVLGQRQPATAQRGRPWLGSRPAQPPAASAPAAEAELTPVRQEPVVETSGARAPRRHKRRFTGRRLLLAAVSLTLATGLGLTLLPLWLLRHVEQRSNSCLARLREEPAHDADACLPSARELYLPLALPWLRSEAEALQRELGFQAAELSYELATASYPDAGRRARAAERLLALTRSVDAPSTVDPLRRLQAGAFAELAAGAARSDDKQLRALGFEAALAIGALAPLDQLARYADRTEPFSLNLRRGAFLCLAGDREAGVAALIAADAAHRASSEHGDGYGPARLGLLACDEPASSRLPFDPRNVRPALRPALQALEAQPAAGVDELERLLRGAERPLAAVQRCALAALVITQQRRPTAAELLALVAPRQGPAISVAELMEQNTTPWLIRARRPYGLLLIDPAVLQRAAGSLAAAAAEVGEVSCDGAVATCPSDLALAGPAATLRDAAAALWLAAAIEHTRRGSRAQALGSLRSAGLLLSGPDELWLPVIRLAAGDPQGALEGLQLAGSTSLPPAQQAAADLTEALALAGRGLYGEAGDVARRAFQAGGAGPAEARAAAGWLWGALALKAGSTKEIAGSLGNEIQPSLHELSRWLTIAATPEAQRLPKRRDLTLGEAPAAVLPAVMHVVAGAVPPGADVEVWLDRIFADAHRAEPLRTILARAEAARWRGDQQAAALWDERAAALNKLLEGRSSPVLASALGIL